VKAVSPSSVTFSPWRLGNPLKEKEKILRQKDFSLKEKLFFPR
jgi:hypothetical protein